MTYLCRDSHNTGYHHPIGTHDDVFWATALAAYATTNMEPRPFLTIVSR